MCDTKDSQPVLATNPQFHGEQAALGGPNRAARRAARSALGNTAKSVGRSCGCEGETKSQAARKRRFKHQRHAAKLLGGRVGLCRWALAHNKRAVEVVTSQYGSTGEVRSHFEGLQTCGSVWSCPCCSARISETRRDEMNTLLSWARKQGLEVRLVTLTARHGRGDDLKTLLDRMKKAKQRLHQHRSYKALKPSIVGSVVATEVTGGGRHGWHPHFHIIYQGCKLPTFWQTGLVTNQI